MSTTTVSEANFDADSDADFLDCVRADPKLTPIERELVIRTSYEDDRLEVFSEIPCIVRGLMKNPQFDPARWRVCTKEQSTHASDGQELAEFVEDGYVIVGIWGSLPVGALSIKSTCRSTQNFGRVVATA
jgi:hypothetical protein